MFPLIFLKAHCWFVQVFVFAVFIPTSLFIPLGSNKIRRVILSAKVHFVTYDLIDFRRGAKGR